MNTVTNGVTTDVNREEFARALSTWRIRSGFTQKALAERWHTSRYTIMDVEGGKPVSWRTAYKLFVLLTEELRRDADEAKRL